MASAARALPAADAARVALDAHWAETQRHSVLRFITCGSVDDGKSTLIGRLLYDTKLLHDDQLAALERESRAHGSAGGGLDFSLLVDGLAAEREQGITIDVAYRFFVTERRTFIVADTPGHVQYTRNMVTGASTADLAVILIDARKGVLEQTRRHSMLAHLLGIRRVVLAVNKMDLVGHDAARFRAIVANYLQFAEQVGIADVTAIPLSGLTGENIAAPSQAMLWYDGPTLLDHLETVPLDDRRADAGFAMPVQWVNRPDPSFRGYAGRIAAGVVRPGDAVTILPSGQGARVARIVTLDGDLPHAVAGQSVTLTLDRERDCSRGDLIVALDAPLPLADGLDATLVWLAAAPLVPRRAYWLKIGTQTVAATVERIEHVMDMTTLDRAAGRPLALNDIGGATLRLDRAVPLARYADSRTLGRFILIDRITNETVAAGMIDRANGTAGLRRPTDPDSRILWVIEPTASERAARAAAVRRHLAATGEPSVLFDEAALRAGLNADLAEDEAGRAEFLRRTREAAQLIADAGVHVVIALDADPAEAFPGRRVDASWDEHAADQWVI